ncbi:AAA family ATPase [Tuwongella immobilis]|uniref:Uncharacterized protein n=1 Tax=Tuwongella immobilis TaxID=692036 RepID=A0A6C2YRJ2_9BACT|nr:hypothetical protein [Tuwongella immobilis]VIP03977.1 unnamed protein product [Tuwongella immobilis]VTS05321.1 unnamed protein product [Tuwongella immobilis]
MDEFQLGSAFIQLEVRGDIAQDLEKQRQIAEAKQKQIDAVVYGTPTQSRQPPQPGAAAPTPAAAPQLVRDENRLLQERYVLMQKIAGLTTTASKVVNPYSILRSGQSLISTIEQARQSYLAQARLTQDRLAQASQIARPRVMPTPNQPTGEPIPTPSVLTTAPPVQAATAPSRIPPTPSTAIPTPPVQSVAPATPIVPPIVPLPTPVTSAPTPASAPSVVAPPATPLPTSTAATQSIIAAIESTRGNRPPEPPAPPASMVPTSPTRPPALPTAVVPPAMPARLPALPPMVPAQVPTPVPARLPMVPASLPMAVPTPVPAPMPARLPPSSAPTMGNTLSGIQTPLPVSIVEIRAPLPASLLQRPPAANASSPTQPSNRNPQSLPPSGETRAQPQVMKPAVPPSPAAPMPPAINRPPEPIAPAIVEAIAALPKVNLPPPANTSAGENQGKSGGRNVPTVANPNPRAQPTPTIPASLTEMVQPPGGMAMDGMIRAWSDARRAEAKEDIAFAKMETRRLAEAIRAPMRDSTGEIKATRAELARNRAMEIVELQKQLLRQKQMLRTMDTPQVQKATTQREVVQQRLQQTSSLQRIREMETQAKVLQSPVGRNAATAQALEFQQATVYNLQRQIVYQQQLNRLIESPGGRQAIREQARLQEELAAAQRRGNNATIIAEQGRYLGTLTILNSRLEAYQNRLKAISGLGATAFGSGLSAIVGLSRLANPAAYERFQYAFADLGAVIGRELVPYLEKLTAGIRWVADSFVQLDPATRSFIGRAIVIGTVIGGLVMVLPLLAGGLRYATVAMIALRAAMTLLSRNPVLAVTGAVVSLGAAFVAAGKKVAEWVGLTKGGMDEVQNKAKQTATLDQLLQPSLAPADELQDQITRQERIVAETKKRLGEFQIPLPAGEPPKNNLLPGLLPTTPRVVSPFATPEVNPANRVQVYDPSKSSKLIGSPEYDSVVAESRQAEQRLEQLQAKLREMAKKDPTLLNRMTGQPQAMEMYRNQYYSRSATYRAGATFGDGSSYGAAGRDASFMGAEQFLKSIQIDAMKAPITSDQIAERTADNTGRMANDLNEIKGLLRQNLNQSPTGSLRPAPSSPTAPNYLNDPSRPLSERLSRGTMGEPRGTIPE